jgi:hypothetical protein
MSAARKLKRTKLKKELSTNKIRENWARLQKLRRNEK